MSIRARMLTLQLSIAFSCLLTAVLSAPLATKSGDEPDFCHGLDCPAFTRISVNKEGDYELRQYNASKWVGTVISESGDWDAAARTAFDKLFDYISGANTAKEKIPMAAPVATKLVPLPSGKYNFTILFFTPFKYQTNTPKPTDPTCALVDLPPLNVYVRSFGGYADTQKVLENTGELAAALDKSGVQYVKPTEFSFEAGYDSPYRVLGRHNEVWLAAA